MFLFNFFFFTYSISISFCLYIYFFDKDRFNFIFKDWLFIFKSHSYTNEIFKILHSFLKINFLITELIPIYLLSVNKLRFFYYILAFYGYPIFFIFYEDNNFFLQRLFILFFFLVRNAFFLFFLFSKLKILRRLIILFNFNFLSHKHRNLSKKIMLLFLGDNIFIYFNICLFFFCGFFFEAFIYQYEQNLIFDKCSVLVELAVKDMDKNLTFFEFLEEKEKLDYFYYEQLKKKSFLNGEGSIFIVRKIYMKIKTFLFV
jgi:hypothetical protein